MRRSYALLGRITLLAVFGLNAGACVSWKTQSASPEQVVAKKPDQVRVTLGNGSRIVVAAPTIIGDSLIGTAPGAGSDPKHAAPRRVVSLSDVQSVEVQRVNAGKTGLLIAGVGV